MARYETLALVAISFGLWQPIYGLLYPRSSVFQLVGGVSVPVRDLPKMYRLLIDWGFQVNYDFPFELSSFYNVPIFPNFFGGTRNKRHYEQPIEMQGGMEYNVTQIPGDFGTLQFYQSMEQLLEHYDIHPSCLLLAICELALHPFEKQQQNLLTELLAVVLTPSKHDDLQSAEGKIYLEAETIGATGCCACANIYQECQINLFAKITRTVF